MSGARRVAAPLAAGLGVAAYAAAFRRYGIFDPVDEGLLLVQAWRAAHGQVPYVDFHTGYGPLYFALQALLVGAGGMEAVRWALVAVHGASAALLYALARRLCGPALAAAAVALEVAFFLPVAPGRGAPFNAPYPAWYAGLVGVGIALLLAGRRARLARAGAVGVVCGLVFAMKPNSGVLLAAGAAAALALGAVRDAPAGWTARAVLVLIALGAAVLVAPTGATLAAAVLVPPLVALALLGVERGAGEGEALASMAALAAGFVAVAAVAFAPSLATLGFARFAREVLLVGAGVAEVYALRFPWPALLAALVGLLAFVGRGRPAGLLVAASLGVLGLALGSVATQAALPLPALRAGAEVAALTAVPLVVWGALAALRRGRDDALAAATGVTALAVLQLYPRPDFVHLMPLGVLLVPLALCLWRPAVALVLPARAAPAVALALPLVLAAGRFLPTASALGRVLGGGVVQVELGSERLVIEAEGSAPLRALAAAADEARALPAGESVLAFPACGMVPFLAARRPAGPHDYFFPGRPDREEAAALTARFAAAPPPLAVTCSAADTPLAGAWNYYPELVRFLTTRYRQRVAHPPYFVLEPR